MVKLIIRDDDLCYYSKVDDIERIYKEIEGFPISFATIPTVTDVSTVGACPDTRGNTVPRWIGDNKALSYWLKEKLRKKEIDVLMHGISHGYSFVQGKRLAEMQWRKELNLKNEIAEQKNKIRNLT